MPGGDQSVDRIRPDQHGIKSFARANPTFGGLGSTPDDLNALSGLLLVMGSQLPDLRIDYGWLAPSLARLCKLEQGLVAFVRGAPSHTKHFIGLAITGAMKHPNFPEAVLAAALASTPRRDLLARLWGKDLGSTRALMRLGREVFEQRTYDALAAILADPERRKALGDLPRPTEKAILRIASVPQTILAQYRGRLIGAFGGNGLTYLVEGVGRIRPDLTPAAIRQALNRLENPQKIDHLMMRLTRDLDLPDVPWNGAANIIPLRTVPALRATGLRLENCLNSLSIWCEALRGVRAFYLIEGDELCVAALARHPLFETWYLQSLAKRRNGTPSPEMTARMVDAFAAAGFPYFDGDVVGAGDGGGI